GSGEPGRAARRVRLSSGRIRAAVGAPGAVHLDAPRLCGAVARAANDISEQGDATLSSSDWLIDAAAGARRWPAVQA
ncbi:hypothetical protein, partial [Burkholderia sp. LMG 13014]|uniref:hypothetical protein n=1 Tax=Burkholderia sp. LMG 13014 TaxID=2709306 RepID=UPI00196676DE